ncbi:MAG: nucleoside monophosphate kinase, partial [Deltaproteobacteria bacterium]|nr:nucleoside monophosphate kinase [Deltaproteobacteria bacterium]
MHIVLFGQPGSGKGTQAKLLVEKYDYFHFSTGEVLRKEITAQTD